MRKLTFALFAFAACAAASAPASALICQGSNTATLKKMYNASQQSGDEPAYAVTSFQSLPGIAIGKGTASGLLNYLVCWDQQPRCLAPALLGSVNLTFYATGFEMQQFGNEPVNALRACFARLGNGSWF
jgi:hypothetical protein